MSVVTLISFLALWRINSEKLVLENRLATLSASEASLRLAASQPQFSVQYLRTSSVTWDKLISGSELKPLTSRKTRFAVEAAEHMWEYPIIQTHLADSLSDDLFGSSKEINRELKDEWGSTLADYEVFDINHLLILISAFGGSKARNVRVIYDEYDFVGAKYLFEDYDFTDMFDDDSLQTTVKRDNLSLRKIRKSMQLGDIAPGDGRMIELSDCVPMQVHRFGANADTQPLNIYPNRVLIPRLIVFEDLSGKTIEAPVRRPLDFPIPISETDISLG